MENVRKRQRQSFGGSRNPINSGQTKQRKLFEYSETFPEVSVKNHEIVPYRFQIVELPVLSLHSMFFFVFYIISQKVASPKPPFKNVSG